MGRYVARRLLQFIPVFIGVTMLVFAMVYLLPGDPIIAMFGDRRPNPSVVAALRHRYHLDQPLYMQYLHYLKSAVTLDFGETYSGRSVSAVLKDAFPVTIRLTVVAFLFEMIIGLGAGVIAGLRRGKWFDTSSLFGTLIVISIPTFVLGFVLQFFVGVKLGWFKPTVGVGAPIKDMLLPGMVLGSLSLAYVLRLTRTSIAENLRADYVRTATAKGMPRRRVVRVHLLRNSLIPVVTFLGADIGSLMGGAIVTEGIFNIPGVGFHLFRAIRIGEGPTIVAIVTVLVIIYLVTSLIVDLLYAVLDPRIRYA
jgi:oligopeptide transport system permease protein